MIARPFNVSDEPRCLVRPAVAFQGIVVDRESAVGANAVDVRVDLRNEV